MTTPAPSSHEITLMLHDWSAGNREALEKLLPLVYDELHRQAARYLRRERPDHTLQTTALIHEAYLKLVDQRQVHWQNRAHFFAIAAQLMRRILVDHARTHRRAKRGGGDIRVTLTEAVAGTQERDINLIALDEALSKLAAFDARQGRIVELRFFGGLDVEATAAVLGLSPATIKSDWSLAKAWLQRELTRGAHK
jgi:RNA polymerase sigma factor (TIGR02999 family)